MDNKNDITNSRTTVMGSHSSLVRPRSAGLVDRSTRRLGIPVRWEVDIGPSGIPDSFRHRTPTSSGGHWSPPPRPAYRLYEGPGLFGETVGRRRPVSTRGEETFGGSLETCRGVLRGWDLDLNLHFPVRTFESWRQGPHSFSLNPSRFGGL